MTSIANLTDTLPDPSKADTDAAFTDPQPGDSFQEMFSFWMFVLSAAPDGGPVEVLELSAPGRVPDDGKLLTFESADAFRRAYAYRTIPGYSVRLARRGVDVTGWRDHAIGRPTT